MIQCNKIPLKDHYQIIKYHIVNGYIEYKKDIISRKRISATVCSLDHNRFNLVVDDNTKTVRETANNKFDKDYAEKIAKEIEEELNVL